MKSFENKIAVITGAGSGIGRELALQLSQKGALMAICDVRKDSLRDTRKMIEQQDRKCFSAVVDVSKREEVYRFAEEVMEQYGVVNIVVNNAGVALSNVSAEKLCYEDFEWIMGINFWGTVYGTKAFLPYLLEQNQAHIVNLSSVYGLTAVAKATAYCSSKFAVRGFTEALRQELRATPVAVALVHPGGIRTHIARHSRAAKDGEFIADPAEAVRKFEQRAQTAASEAARCIINGISHNLPRVVIGKDAKFLDVLGRLRPALYDRFMLKHVVQKAEKA